MDFRLFIIAAQHNLGGIDHPDGFLTSIYFNMTHPIYLID